MILTKEWEAQIRASAGDMDTAAVGNFRAGVIERLQKFLDSGGVREITTHHVRSAITAEHARKWG